jgi:mRNA interferase RelE/StbE
VTVRFKESFVRDLRHIKDKGLLTRVSELIELVEQAQHLGHVANLKKLGGGGNYYCIMVGDYRLGLIVEGDAVTFVWFLHRKDIYRYFPSVGGAHPGSRGPRRGRPAGLAARRAAVGSASVGRREARPQAGWARPLGGREGGPAGEPGPADDGVLGLNPRQALGARRRARSGEPRGEVPRVGPQGPALRPEPRQGAPGRAGRGSRGVMTSARARAASVGGSVAGRRQPAGRDGARVGGGTGTRPRTSSGGSAPTRGPGRHARPTARGRPAQRGRSAGPPGAMGAGRWGSTRHARGSPPAGGSPTACGRAAPSRPTQAAYAGWGDACSVDRRRASVVTRAGAAGRAATAGEGAGEGQP